MMGGIMPSMPMPQMALPQMAMQMPQMSMGMRGVPMPPQPPNMAASGMYGAAYPQPAVMPPTRVLRLSNMVTAQDLQDDEEYNDIREDVRQECNGFGRVVQVIIPRVRDRFPAAAEGFIFVEFSDSGGAMTAKNKLAGRKFADKLVLADYYDEAKYSRREYV
jgi:splicing factor U2AF subunit